MSDDFDVLVGQNVRDCRVAAGMSQAALADALSKSGDRLAQQTILKIEQGSRPLKFAEAMRVSEVLGIPVSALTKESKQAVAEVYLTGLIDSVRQRHVDLQKLAEQLSKPLADLALAVDVNRRLSTQDRASAARIELAAEWLTVQWGNDFDVALIAAISKYAGLDETPSTVAAALKRTLPDGGTS